jgi:anti-sigma B factor antagonist
MSQPSFHHLKLRDVNGVAVVDFVDADIVFASAVVQEIGEELRSLVKAQGYTKILLNFESVQYLSSSMLGQLTRLQKDVDEIRGQLKLVGLGPTLQDIFKIGRFDRIFAIYDDELSAMQSFR